MREKQRPTLEKFLRNDAQELGIPDALVREYAELYAREGFRRLGIYQFPASVGLNTRDKESVELIRRVRQGMLSTAKGKEFIEKHEAFRSDGVPFRRSMRVENNRLVVPSAFTLESEHPTTNTYLRYTRDKIADVAQTLKQRRRRG